MRLEQASDLAQSFNLWIYTHQDALKRESFGPGERPLPASHALSTALVEPLSARGLEVLQMLAESATNQETAQKLYIDVRTVKSHNTHIFPSWRFVTVSRRLRKPGPWALYNLIPIIYFVRTLVR